MKFFFLRYLNIPSVFSFSSFFYIDNHQDKKYCCNLTCYRLILCTSDNQGDEQKLNKINLETLFSDEAQSIFFLCVKLEEKKNCQYICTLLVLLFFFCSSVSLHVCSNIPLTQPCVVLVVLNMNITSIFVIACPKIIPF